MYIYIWSEKYTTDFAAKHVFEWEVATTVTFVLHRKSAQTEISLSSTLRIWKHIANSH